MTPMIPILALCFLIYLWFREDDGPYIVAVILIFVAAIYGWMYLAVESHGIATQDRSGARIEAIDTTGCPRVHGRDETGARVIVDRCK